MHKSNIEHDHYDASVSRNSPFTSSYFVTKGIHIKTAIMPPLKVNKKTFRWSFGSKKPIIRQSGQLLSWPGEHSNIQDEKFKKITSMDLYFRPVTLY